MNRDRPNQKRLLAGVVAPIRSTKNRPCPCGSRKKFKLCCYRKDTIATKNRPRPRVEC